MASEHLKFVIPGAILAATGGIMLFYGLIFGMIFRLGGISGYMMGSMSTTITILGIIFLIIGIVLIVKGVSVYRSGSKSSYKYNRPIQPQPVLYTPSSVPSYAPVSSPSYAPAQTPTVILDTPPVIQDPTPPKETMAPEKKYCPSCGAELPGHTQAHFCPACGGPI